MTSQNLELNEQKPVRRFTTPEEFLREYYPKSTEQDAHRKTEDEGDLRCGIGPRFAKSAR
jgi:hypothetical protein